MSTRAMYTFHDFKGSDDENYYNVYKHYDGFPEAGIESIRNATKYSWAFPRFEANEFAAAFVAVNKPGVSNPLHPIGGGVRLLRSGKGWKSISPGDTSYRYVITHDGTNLIVSVYNIDDAQSKLLYKGTLEEVEKKVNGMG